MSYTTVITFKKQESSSKDRPSLDGKRHVLLAFTSHGWIDDQGIDFNKVSWYIFDLAQWTNMMTALTKVASKEKNEAVLKDTLTNGVDINKAIKVKEKP